MSTQLYKARAGIVTPEMDLVAASEGVDKHWLRDEMAQGRIVSMLEGGYVLSALARSVAAHIRVLAGI